MKTLTLLLLVVPTLAIAADRSSFYFSLSDLSTHTAVHFFVTDPLERQTGRLVTGTLVEQIPDSSYGIEGVDPEESGFGGETSTFHMRPTAAGTYTVTVLGEATTSYLLTLLAENQAGQHVDAATLDIRGFIVAGSTRQYQLQFDPTSNASIRATKTVSFPSLRQDLQTAFQLGQIGDAKFVAKLNKILAKGEKALTKKGGKDRENKKEAVEKLRQFIQKLEKAFKGEKDDTHDEDDDKDHDNEHGEKDREKSAKRFVSELAFKSLKGDAETLIVTLGGKPGKRDDE